MQWHVAVTYTVVYVNVAEEKDREAEWAELKQQRQLLWVKHYTFVSVKTLP